MCEEISKVLIVEDSEASATAVKIILRKLGHDVDHARTGAEGLLLASKNDYGVILMDLGLPDMNGFEVCKEIRQLEHPDRSAVTIIALTSHLEMQDRCFESGMQGLIPKPLLENQMQNILGQNKTPLESKDDGPSELIKISQKEEDDRLVRAVIKDLKSKRSDLISAYEERNSSALRRTLHHIKGGVCYIQRPVLSNSLSEFHSAVRTDFQDKERLNLMLSRLLDLIDVFCYETDVEEEPLIEH